MYIEGEKGKERRGNPFAKLSNSYNREVKWK